jgi:gentisate 1,2-dioxygenase
MVVSEKAVAMITEGTGTIMITEDIEMIPGDHLLVIKKGTEEVHHQETDIGMDLLVKDLGVLQAIDLEDLQGTDQEDQMIG